MTPEIDRTTARWLLVGLVVLYPFHTHVAVGSYGVFNLSFGDPLVAVIGVLWLVGAFGHRVVPPYVIPIAGFVLVGGISLTVAVVVGEPYVSSSGGIAALAKFMGAVAWMLAIYIVGRHVGITGVKIALFFLVIVAGGIAILTIHAAVIVADGRPLWPFENPNLLANFFVLSSAFALFVRDARVFDFEPTARWPFVLSTSVLFAVATIATGSRGGFLALIVFWAVAIVVTRRHLSLDGRFIRVIAAAGAVVLAALAVFIARNGRLLEWRPDETRRTLWEQAVDAFTGEPILGVGFGQARHYIAWTTGEERGVHNTYLAILAETGLMGAILFGMILSFVAWTVAQRRDHVDVLVIGAFVVATLAQGLVTDVETFRGLWLAIGVIGIYGSSLSLTGAIGHESEEDESR